MHRLPLFFARRASYSGVMSIFPGLAARARGLFIDTMGPWGPTGSGGGGEHSSCSSTQTPRLVGEVKAGCAFVIKKLA